MSKHFIEQEVAEIFRCSLSKVRKDRWLKTGCPYLKNGNRVIYAEKDVEAYLEKIRVETK